MLDRSEVGKRGYLNEDYRLFHPKDTRALKLGYHYHEFDKLVFLLRGGPPTPSRASGTSCGPWTCCWSAGT